MASRVVGCRRLVVAALVAFGVFGVREARAESDALFIWLASGSKGAMCSSASTPATCHRFLGNDCIRAQCDTARAIADVKCQAGSPDCNVCVDNVRQKFDELFADGYWRQEAWRFGWETRYTPSNLTPNSVYDDPSWQDFFGIPVTHVQGFVHTNSVTLPLAVSHSDDAHGSISLIRPNGLGHELEAIHETDSHHPSGIFALGKYVGFMDGSNNLRLIDLNRSLESHRIVHELPREFEPVPQPPPDPIFDCWSEPELVAAGVCTLPPPPPAPHSVGTGGGGVAVARLLGGAHLLVASQGSGGGGNHFVLLEGDVENPSRLTYLGFVEYQGPSQYIGSENLSLVTECGSGDIYTVHVTGDDLVDFWPVTAGDGYFRLSKISWDNGADKPVLSYQTALTMEQDDEDCWLRGAGTIHSKPGGIEAYCHARDENSSGPNRFNYRVRKPTIEVQPVGPCPPGEVCIDLCGEPPLPLCNF